MKSKLGGLYHWAARIQGLTIALIVGAFALNVFDEGYSFWEIWVRFLVYLLPTFALLVVLIIAWRNEITGAALYTALWIILLITLGGHGGWWNIGMLFSPLLLTGVLFLASRLARDKSRPL
jgi:hypothetical protein